MPQNSTTLLEKGMILGYVLIIVMAVVLSLAA